MSNSSSPLLEVKNLKNILKHLKECCMQWMMCHLPLTGEGPWE